MKIASFNINNINRRLANLLNWLREAEPEIVCLQEIKSADIEFPTGAIRQAGYHAVFRGESRWNGVAILARWPPVVTRLDLPGGASDEQCRYLEAAVNGVLVASIYAPNGNPQPGPKFDYKLAWLKRLIAHAAQLCATGAPVVLAGDYNVVPTDLDIYSTKSWDRDALLQPQSRAAYQRLLAQGWTDAIRALHPKEPMYTFWDYMRKRWERNGGLRLDQILLSSALTERLQSAGVDRQTRGMDGASDQEFDDDLIEQLNVLPELVAAFGFVNAKAPGYEADDFLAAAVAAEERGGGSALVASGDRDSFQLASSRTTILYPSRGGEIARIGPDEVRQRYGVDPNQVPDFIALRGDPSDKLPGAPGVGPKRAAQLVRRYGTLEGVLEAGLFQTQAEVLRLYRLIATMDASAPLPSLADQMPAWASASSLARSWRLNQLADRLDEKALAPFDHF
jgi:exodeoxyribonuclease III